MKKNGFTLAEVLITLTIIGVIATMTLPALMTNTQEQQARTGLKKGIGTLTDIAQMNSAIDGFDYAGINDANFGNPDITNHRSLYAMLANRGSVDFQKSTSTLTNNREMTTAYAIPGGAPTAIMYFRDGSAVLYNPTATNITTQDGIGTTMIDGLPMGFTVIYDTNGAKGPNILSNCVGASQGGVDADARYTGNGLDQSATWNDVETNCEANNGRNRVIKDQFMVQMRAGTAVPRGAAAQWAYNK